MIRIYECCDFTLWIKKGKEDDTITKSKWKGKWPRSNLEKSLMRFKRKEFKLGTLESPDIFVIPREAVDTIIIALSELRPPYSHNI